MKTVSLICLMMILLLAACTQQYSIDGAKQVAANAVLTNDRYTQNEVENFQLLSESEGDCDSCYVFQFTFDAKVEEKPNIRGYAATVQVMNGEVSELQFSELPKDTAGDYPIEDTTDQLCVNKCGDGLCQEIVCQSAGCPCTETKDTCPDDC